MVSYCLFIFGPIYFDINNIPKSGIVRIFIGLRQLSTGENQKKIRSGSEKVFMCCRDSGGY